MEQLNTYIQQARQQGQTDEQIRQNSVASGWALEQVNAALGSVAASPPATPGLNQPGAIVQPGTPQVSNQAPIVSGYSAPGVNSQSTTPTNRRSKLLIIIAGLVVIVIIAIGSIFILGGNKGYQSVIQEFITAVQDKDKAKADSLESPAAKAYFQKNGGTSSFYTGCQEAGALCTDSFSKSYLAKATKTYKDYTASNGTKGKEEVFTIKQSSGGQACGSGSSTTITITVVPSGGSWLIDNVSEGGSSNATSCPASGGSTSSSSTSTNNSSSSSNSSANNLQPAAVGAGQCDSGSVNDGSSYAQVALSGSATCTDATNVINGVSGQEGSDYTSNGYSCTVTTQSGNTQWSTYWSGDFYSYSCASGSDQVAYNIQTSAQSGQ